MVKNSYFEIGFIESYKTLVDSINRPTLFIGIYHFVTAKRWAKFSVPHFRIFRILTAFIG